LLAQSVKTTWQIHQKFVSFSICSFNFYLVQMIRNNVPEANHLCMISLA
jgi:hypothetical protein